MKKRILTVALALIFCCLGLFTFAGCERKPEYTIKVTSYPTACGKFVAKMTTENNIAGVYATPNEYKEAVFANIKIEVYTYGTTDKVFEATGLQDFRNKGGSLEGANISSVGTHTVEIKYGHDYVTYQFTVTAGAAQEATSTGSTEITNSSTSVEDSGEETNPTE